MGILFRSNVLGLSTESKYKLLNQTIALPDLEIITHVDLTVQSDQRYRASWFPYAKDLNVLAKSLAVPKILLGSLKKYNLHYTPAIPGQLEFSGKRTVVYVHGLGSVAEDNSILHRQLLEEGCDLIRISYDLKAPKKPEQMTSFLEELTKSTGPQMLRELETVLSGLKKRFPNLFQQRELILLAYSLGSGLAANLLIENTFGFTAFVNLDGTLLAPAIEVGASVPQLHLSQDGAELVGDGYAQRIEKFRSKSRVKNCWIQIGSATHYTFTDFPNLLQPYFLLQKMVGSQKSAERIRTYVCEFIRTSKIEQSDSRETLLTSGSSE